MLPFMEGKLSIVVVMACLILGYILKQWVGKLDNKYIPTILAITGAIFGCIANNSITFENMVYGAFSGLASTGLHQMFIQCIEKGSCGMLTNNKNDK